ncbi:MAG: hypothetical protein AAF664_10425 [Planctomycetota bacterium]
MTDPPATPPIASNPPAEPDQSDPKPGEHVVLLPSSTLEDFPSDLPDAEARSLLAGWTVLWHPGLLTRLGRLPQWYRADDPPAADRFAEEIEDPELAIASQIVVIPEASEDQTPESYVGLAEQYATVIHGDDRASMVEKLVEAGLIDPSIWQTLDTPRRSISVSDFFALGFLDLQIQVMTRRLRYTSNLDRPELQRQVVSAAHAMSAGDGSTCEDALQACFDLLAEERDHYFSSDPHLIDLTLVTESVIETAAKSLVRPGPAGDGSAETNAGSEGEASSNESSGDYWNSAATVWPHHLNALLDADAIESIQSRHEEPAIEAFCEALADGQVGFAAGGPSADVVLDWMDHRGATNAITDAFEKVRHGIGVAPQVFGRLTGGVPSDLIGQIVKLGYRGLIPIDFVEGTGASEESKVSVSGDGEEIEALTTRPIDASSDASFLTIGVRLGSELDAGEVATALLTHWPGKSCDSFEDLIRLSSWTIALGRFWKLDEYFTSGQRPYHHAVLGSKTLAASETLLSQHGSLRQAAQNYCEGVRASQLERLNDLADFLDAGSANPDSADSGPSDEGVLADRFAQVLGFEYDEESAKQQTGDVVVINPMMRGTRTSIECGGFKDNSSIFAASVHEGRSHLMVDAPGGGFTLIRSDSNRAVAKRPGSGSKISRWLRERITGGGEEIAGGMSLQNEFLEAIIDPNTGALASVISGAVRGNRMSWRLVNHAWPDATMRLVKSKAINHGLHRGLLECDYEWKADNQSTARGRITYQLDRGQRRLLIRGEIDDLKAPAGRDGLWEQWVSQAAFSDAAASYYTMVRDKMVATSKRELVSPLGLLVDQVDRRTVLSARGLGLHRRVGDRFLETLVADGRSDATKHRFEVSFVFDPPFAIQSAIESIAEPLIIRGKAPESMTETGFFVQISGGMALLESIERTSADHSRLTLLNPESATLKTRLRCCLDIKNAHRVVYRANCESPDEEETLYPIELRDDQSIPLEIAAGCRQTIVLDH